MHTAKYKHAHSCAHTRTHTYRYACMHKIAYIRVHAGMDCLGCKLVLIIDLVLHLIPVSVYSCNGFSNGFILD